MSSGPRTKEFLKTLLQKPQISHLYILFFRSLGFEIMTLKYQCNVNTKCTYLRYAAEADSTEVFSLAVRDRFILLLLLLLVFLLPHLIFLGLYTQNLVRTNFIPEEIFYIIIFKQATGFLYQLNEVKPLLQFFSKVWLLQDN
jgi:hypothetical protein